MPHKGVRARNTIAHVPLVVSVVELRVQGGHVASNIAVLCIDSRSRGKKKKCKVFRQWTRQFASILRMVLISRSLENTGQKILSMYIADRA